MPRSALLYPKIKIWAVTGNLGLEIGMLRAKQQGCCKKRILQQPLYRGFTRFGLPILHSSGIVITEHGKCCKRREFI